MGHPGRFFLWGFIAFLAVIGNMKKDPAMDIFNKYKTHAAQDKTTQQS